MEPYHRLSIAPMMSYTDRHFRYLMRLFTKEALLYTEMVVGTTIIYNLESSFLERILGFEELEHPISVQLGGDDARILETAARFCEDRGYDEINLNVGCPSDRVQKGRFGACLMKDAEQVAALMEAMHKAVRIPVTVKHRLGVDELDDYEHLAHFVSTVAARGIRIFIVHARKAWLKGLNPAQNRTVPPLDYRKVYRLKHDFPHLSIIINGGIQSPNEVTEHLRHVDGTMIGRAAYHQPELFARVDSFIFGRPPVPALSPLALIEQMDEYVHHQREAGTKISFTIKHLTGLFKNRPGSRLWRRKMSQLIQENPRHFNLAEIYKDTFGPAWDQGL